YYQMKFLYEVSLIVVFFAYGAGGDFARATEIPHVDKNCKDFATQEQAQAYFESLGGSVKNNVDRLDGNDRDGIVCESNPSVSVLEAREDSRIKMSSMPVSVQFSGRVIEILDGDTIVVLNASKKMMIRLSEIDCPEKDQDFGRDATQFTAERAFGKIVTLAVNAVDSYGRRVAQVTLPDGRNLNRELIKAGLAWWYERFSRDVSLRDLEQKAKNKKIGLWRKNKPMAPWIFRRKFSQ
ncbi:MAG: thermonuclease family protein, partial [Nitrospiria bacterium]